LFEFVTYSADKLETFLLVMFRAGGLFISAPILSNKNVPAMIKAGFAIILAIILLPLAARTQPLQISSVWTLAILAAKEVLTGFAIGFFFSLLFIAVQMAGSIVGYQIGLAIVNVLDPEAGSEVSIIGEFWYIVAALLFLAIDGHHAVLSAFADSYRLIPVGFFNFSGTVQEFIVRFTAYSFVMAVKIAAPVIITLFLTEVALGVVARTVPQMNIFIVGLPLKIGVGFLIIAVSLPVFRFIIEKSVLFLDNQVVRLIAGIGTT
jgi:flagellar biosynthetic protein FliR